MSICCKLSDKKKDELKISEVQNVWLIALPFVKVYRLRLGRQTKSSGRKEEKEGLYKAFEYALIMKRPLTYGR